MKAGKAAGKFRDQASFVRSSSIPEDEYVPTQVTQEVGEKPVDLQLLDVLEVEPEEKVEALTPGTDGDAGDDRDPIAAIEVPENRRPAQRGPALGDGGSQKEARFVGEDEVGTQPLGVFFTRGQS